jgi:hypothetical protein
MSSFGFSSQYRRDGVRTSPSSGLAPFARVFSLIIGVISPMMVDFMHRGKWDPARSVSAAAVVERMGYNAFRFSTCRERRGQKH